jgi:hypothetical protein
MNEVKDKLERMAYVALDYKKTSWLVVEGFGTFKVWFQDKAPPVLSIMWRGRDTTCQDEWHLAPGEDETGFIDDVVNEWWATFPVEKKLCIGTLSNG